MAGRAGKMGVLGRRDPGAAPIGSGGCGGRGSRPGVVRKPWEGIAKRADVIPTWWWGGGNHTTAPLDRKFKKLGKGLAKTSTFWSGAKLV